MDTMTNAMNRIPTITLPTNPIEYASIRNAVRFYATKVYHLPTPLQQAYFENYFLLYHSGKYLLKEMQAGQITKDGIAYTVIFMHKLTRGKIMQADPRAQYALSFRNPLNGLRLQAIVLVKSLANGRLA